jgi:NAD+ kinase
LSLLVIFVAKVHQLIGNTNMKVVFYGQEINKDWLLPDRGDVSFEMLPRDRIMPGDTDLLVTAGGDGTFLEALQIVKDSGVPIVGINFGRLGFLTGCGPDFIEHLFDAVQKKQYCKTIHTVLAIEQTDLRHKIYPFAINEICIQRYSSAMIEVDVKIDGKHVSTYRGDGIIVATPTGSTAYSLSVGGPIVFPESGVLILSPIAPHNLNVRPIVFKDDAQLEIEVKSRSSKAQLHLDNRSVDIDLPYAFVVKKASFSITSLSFSGNDFITTLREKLMLGFDKRNGGEDYA